jgi:hypothetical protein
MRMVEEMMYLRHSDGMFSNVKEKKRQPTQGDKCRRRSNICSVNPHTDYIKYNSTRYYNSKHMFPSS